MCEQVVRCSWCGRRNRVPDGVLVEASCGRCQSALTWYTWIAPAVRAGTLLRGVQYVGGAALLAVLLGPPLVGWLETEPFRLTDRSADPVEIAGVVEALDDIEEADRAAAPAAGRLSP